MAFAALKNRFAGKAAGVALAATAAFMPIAAHPEEARVQPVAATYSNVAYVSDATTTAYRWSRQNPDGVGIAVYLGSARELTPEQIEGVFRREFTSQGVRRLAFFYEQNDVPQTGFSMVANSDIFGPYGTANVRTAIPQVAGQARLAMSHPELARN